jgi:hypothetical protein
MSATNTATPIPEAVDRLVAMDQADCDLDRVVSSLRNDQAILIRQVAPDRADQLISAVAERFGLSQELEKQASFANFLGHRDRVGKYFMTVNRRANYEFITPHSEGTSFVGMQLASFHCYENSTDGGETILFNADDTLPGWSNLREHGRRAELGASLAPHEVARARGLYQIRLPEDVLRTDDHVLKRTNTAIRGLTLVDVLAKLQRTHSKVLDRPAYVYWDSVASIDSDSAVEFEQLLRQTGLLKEPADGLPLEKLDAAARRRELQSGTVFSQLFRCKITRKLVPGDLVIVNNLTWAHATNNWTPESGVRKVAAAFA